MIGKCKVKSYGDSHPLQRSTPLFSGPLILLLVMYVVSFVLIAGRQQGSTPPMRRMYVIMLIFSAMTCRGRGFRVDVPVGFVVVRLWRGAELHTAVWLFCIVSVTFGSWFLLA